MKAAREKKEKKILTEVERDKKSRIKAILGSIAVATVMWVAMLYIANSIINESAHVECYRAKVDIEDGTKITKDNIDVLVEKCSISEDLVPAGYITDIEQLMDTFTAREYVARDIITTAGVSTEESMTRHIENPIEISVGVTSIDAVVGGILRAGDYINIYSISSNINSTSAVNIVNNAYVTKALDSSGKELSRADKDSTATVINIIIPMQAEKQFNQELMNGTVRMSLVYNPDLENIQKYYEENLFESDETLKTEESTDIQWVGDTLDEQVYTEDSELPEEETEEETEETSSENTSKTRNNTDTYDGTTTGAE